MAKNATLSLALSIAITANSLWVFMNNKNIYLVFVTEDVLEIAIEISPIRNWPVTVEPLSDAICLR